MMQQAWAPDAHELRYVIERSPVKTVLSEAPQRGIEDRLACRHPRLTSKMSGEDGQGLP